MDAVEFATYRALMVGEDPPLNTAELLGLDHLEPWRRDALCREYPGVEFFPTRGQSLEPAKAVCRQCLVSGECASYAAALPPDVAAHGVWAGRPGIARKVAGASRAAPVGEHPCAACGQPCSDRRSTCSSTCRSRIARRHRAA